MAKSKAKKKPISKALETTHMAKVPLDKLGLFWARGFDLEGEELGDVVTHLDEKTRTAFIEYVTRRPADQPTVQKVTAKRRKNKPN